MRWPVHGRQARMRSRHVFALIGAQWRTFASYRVGALLSILSLALTVVPLWFVAGALQPVVENSIRNEGGQYFAFVVTGVALSFVMTSALSSVPEAVSIGIRSGVLEALFCTPATLPSLLVGLGGFDLLWSLLRVMLLGAVLLATGTSFVWSVAPWAVAAIVLTILSYGALGLCMTAMILTVRTSGPFQTAVVTASTLLGGVYYSTTVIPAPFERLADLIPLSWSLRLLRLALLEGANVSVLLSQLLPLIALTSVLLAVGSTAMIAALRHSRRTGTLAQY